MTARLRPALALPLVLFASLAVSGCDSGGDSDPDGDVDGLADVFGDNVLDCDAPAIRSVSIGGSVSGSLATSDCILAPPLDEGGVYYTDLVAFTVEDEADVTVDVTSDDFDAWVYLFDEDGTLIVQDDNGGDGTDARVSRSLEPGVYVVGVTSQSERLTGSYTVRVDD